MMPSRGLGSIDAFPQHRLFTRYSAVAKERWFFDSGHLIAEGQARIRQYLAQELVPISQRVKRARGEEAEAGR